MTKLRFTNITKSFGITHVLENISFIVQEGEFVSILGPSGSGKSTIFRLIGGIIVPDDGEILIDDENIIGKRGSISFMPQTPSLFPWRTVLENVLLGQEIMGKRDIQIARTMLERAGLSEYENASPYELSGGMQQRVSFIRSLLSPQSIICLDEPFSALDEFTRLDMQKWLQSMWLENKRTILFVTHNIEEAIFLSDRIIVLSEKPAKVKKEFVIPFEHPRSEELFLTKEFLDWKKIIFEEMKR